MSLYFSDLDDISNCVDFIICLGGDGTLLYASSLFQVFCGCFKNGVGFYTHWFDITILSFLFSFLGERSTSYGLPPGLPGLPDAFQT